MWLLTHRNTYRAKDEIKKLGGMWKSEEKGWLMPSQASYEEALKFCEAINSRNNYDEDIDGFEHNVKIGLTDDQKDSVAWMFPKLNQQEADKKAIPLKDNIGKKVLSGQKFKGRLPNVRDTWIVCAFKEEWLFVEEKNTFCCINIKTGCANFLTETQIRQHVWLEDMDIELAKKIYKDFVNA
jgi:hypothetical protein